jgi:hypothetical protein
MSATKVMTPAFRVSYPSVFKPTAFEGQEPKFSVVMLFPKETDLSALKAAAKAAVEEKWPDVNKRPKDLRNPFRDGDSEKGDVAGYEGMIFVTAKSKTKPGLVDQNVMPIIEEGLFYAGCWARASVVAYAYDKAGNRGVSFSLQNLQKMRDDDAFSGRAKPEDEFAPVEGAKAPAAATGGTDFLA